MPRQPEGVVRSPDETIDEAQTLLDAGRPFHAHEVFEDAWKSSSADDVVLWQALAQLAVGITHRSRGNAVGAGNLLRRAADGLTPFVTSAPHGLAVGALRDWALAPDRTLPRLRA